MADYSSIGDVRVEEENRRAFTDRYMKSFWTTVPTFPYIFIHIHNILMYSTIP